MNDARQSAVRSAARARRSFTLIELLVVMSIIVIISGITVVAVGAIAKDARISSAKNTVVAALGNARALAMRNNEVVLIAFRAWPDGPTGTDQVIEVVTAKWSGETWVWDCPDVGRIGVDRYVPISDVATRRMPRGVKVAAPLYLAGGIDGAWATSTHLPTTGAGQEMAGVVAVVMFGSDGSRIMRNPQSDATFTFVDFNNDGVQRQGRDDVAVFADYGRGHPLATKPCPDNSMYGFLEYDGVVLEQYWFQRYEDDEPYVVVAPFLAVFDDDDAREIYDVAEWTDGKIRVEDLTDFVNERAERVHFNRYTGVVMR